MAFSHSGATEPTVRMRLAGGRRIVKYAAASLKAVGIERTRQPGISRGPSGKSASIFVKMTPSEKTVMKNGVE